MFWRSVAYLGLEWRTSNFLRFGPVVEIFISESNSDSGSWSRSVMLNMTCMQHLGSIGRGLVGFVIGCRILKFQVL